MFAPVTVGFPVLLEIRAGLHRQFFAHQWLGEVIFGAALWGILATWEAVFCWLHLASQPVTSLAFAMAHPFRLKRHPIAKIIVVPDDFAHDTGTPNVACLEEG